MITTCYRTPDGRLVSSLGEGEFRTALASGQGVLWLDFEAASREEAEPLLGLFDFHHLAVDDCFNRHIDPAKVDDYGRYIFIIAQAVRYEEAGHRVEAQELDLFLGANYVVSFHSQPLPFVTRLRRRCEEDGPELARGADFLAHALIDALVDDYQPVVEELDEGLERLEELVLGRPHPAVLQEIMLLKRNVQRLRRTVIPQRDVVNRMARGEYPEVVRPETHVYYRDIYDHVLRVAELVESARDMADSALNTYLSAVNNRMNEVMKTLSIVAGIFLPLTLIASIYGMNFENMPELGWKWGYFATLGVIAIVGLSLVFFFRLRKWF